MNRLRSAIVGLLAAAMLSVLAGCQSSVQVSDDYQKLPKGEGERRMQETLQRRAAARRGQPPPPPTFSTGNTGSGQ